MFTTHSWAAAEPGLNPGCLTQGGFSPILLPSGAKSQNHRGAAKLKGKPVCLRGNSQTQRLLQSRKRWTVAHTSPCISAEPTHFGAGLNCPGIAVGSADFSDSSLLGHRSLAISLLHPLCAQLGGTAGPSRSRPLVLK